MVNNFYSKIKLNFQLLYHPILINAYVYGKGLEIVHENWGDDINWFFLKEIIKRPVSLFDRISLAMRFNLTNYLVIGSTIDMLCRKNTEIWGAGLIDGSKPLRIKPKKVYAVRGPLTRMALMNQDIDCPEVYGDPALLIAKYYQPHVEKKYKYGFIPHRSNLNDFDQFKGRYIKDCDNILVIDLSQYENWRDIPDQICSCENIISGSLHGLIMAEAYHIPNVWMEFGKPLIGGHFKFHDFFQSIGVDREKPLLVKDKFSLDDIDHELSNWKPGFIDLQPLIDAAPFIISL